MQRLSSYQAGRERRTYTPASPTCRSPRWQGPPAGARPGRLQRRQGSLAAISGLDTCTLDPVWLAASNRTRSAAASRYFISHPGGYHGHGLNAKHGPSRTSLEAHDIVHAFVMTVSISSVKWSSAPVLAIRSVNHSPRRYDSEVMVTSIQMASGAPFWGTTAPDGAHRGQPSGAVRSICLPRRAVPRGEQAEAQRSRCCHGRPG